MKSLLSCTLSIVIILLMVIGSGLVSCNGDDKPYHETRYSDDSKDSVVFIHYRDENGRYNDFFMNYLLFNAMFNNGGYSNCYHHHISSPINQHTYSKYSSRTDVNPYITSKTSSGSPSTPKSSSSSPAPYSTPSKSYSSPSRSSTPSYSTPSKSYSSPSRSYSSPSRH